MLLLLLGIFWSYGGGEIEFFGGGEFFGIGIVVIM